MLVRVLGPLRVETDDGRGIAMTRPVERRILTALAALRPRVVPTDTLIDAVWEDHPPPSARKTLQTSVFRLRDRLGAALVLSESDGYRLSDAAIVDADEFEAATHGASTPAMWDAALAWFQGTPFVDLLSWEPVEARRARLEEVHRSSCEARVEAVLGNGRDDSVITDLEELVAAEPLRERRWCLLIRALDLGGRRAEALAAARRARSLLADELGAPPGAELSSLHEALLTDAHDLDRTSEDVLVAADRARTTADAAVERGEVRAAVDLYVRAAALAREGGDRRRFALAALGAAGSGWQSGLDATADTVSLLREAVELVPAGPTAMRARLLARLAVAQSHHASGSDCEASGRSALAIAEALDDDDLVAEALHAVAVAIDDPLRREERQAVLNRLLDLGSADPAKPWRRWALPLVARLVASEGDIAGAHRALADLAAEAAAAGDRSGLHAAAHASVLAASVDGDWPAARRAADEVRVAGEAALVDPGAARLAHWGMTGIIDLYENGTAPAEFADLEWPTASMAWAALAWQADRFARAGALSSAAHTLSECSIDELGHVERDGYWLATLGMLADAAHLAACPEVADAVGTLLEPVLELTILDPGLIYRGSVAHAAGLAAATCGRHGEARTLLLDAVDAHERHGSRWMAARSSDALAALSGGCRDRSTAP